MRWIWVLAPLVVLGFFACGTSHDDAGGPLYQPDATSGLDAGPEAARDSSLKDTKADTRVDSRADADALDSSFDTSGSVDTADDGDTDLDTDTDTGTFDTRFAALPPWPDADVDAWMTGPAEVGGCGDAGPDGGASDAAPGTRFCELYQDIFAFPGVGKCQTYGCHGGDVGQHDLAMGWTAKSMYDAITTYKTWIEPKDLVKPVPGGDSRPVSALHHALGPDTSYYMPFEMPELSNRKLKADELARIEAWLGRGAPFD